MLTDANKSNDEKLKESRRKELEYLKKNRNCWPKNRTPRSLLQKQLIEARATLSEQIRNEELKKAELKETEFQLKLKELKNNSTTRKNWPRKCAAALEQGSMQLQGEAQELLLEEILRDQFLHDLITEVGKGVEGADRMQIVRNPARYTNMAE